MPKWYTVTDDASAPAGGGKRYCRVALDMQQDGAVQGAWPGAQGTLKGPSSTLAPTRRRRGSGAQAVEDTLLAPMAARVLAVHAEVGAMADTSSALVVLEAMKMEHTMRASQRRRVAEVLVAPGDAVAHGQPLITFAPGVQP